MERRKLNSAPYTTDGKAFSRDSFTNFAASMGYGASNLASGSTYGFNPITRNHTLLEWAYRGSWLVRQVVDAPADDMTRQGITVESDMSPDDIDKLMQYFDNLQLWQRLNETLKWSRLYGGCIAGIMVDGQKENTPLRLETVGEGQFRGLIVLDRWMVWPHLETPVTEPGNTDFGLPKYYEVVSDAKAIPHKKLHHSRCIRFDGIQLPYWQRIAENNWGLSVIEPLYDRLLAFDSTTQGAAQLVYRAHLRTLKIENLRNLLAFGGQGYEAIKQQLQMIRLFQTNESLTVLDSTDEFETHSYAFGGLSDIIIQFAQQLSGAAGIPLVRLFGQSPAGLNATGDSDVRNYYDFLKSQQEARLRRPVTMLLDLCHRSLFNKPLPEGFDFSFNPLWQMTEEQKAKIAVDTTGAISGAFENGMISMPVALKELRQMSKVSGVFSNISDEDIKAAEEMPPPAELAMQEMDMQKQALEQKAAGPQAAPQGGPQKPAGGVPGESTLFQSKQREAAGAASEGHSIPAQHNRAAGVHLNNREDVKKHFIGDELPEGMHAIAGPDETSEAVWLIEHKDHEGNFANYQVMLHYPDREAALAGYRDHHDEAAMGGVKRMSLNTLRGLVSDFKPSRVNGDARG